MQKVCKKVLSGFALKRLKNSVRKFLERFDAIFTLNQDLLLELHYQRYVVAGRWSGVAIPGMRASYEQGHPPLEDFTKLTWRPSGDRMLQPHIQPYFKLHGSSNWKVENGDTLMIMGSAKATTIPRFPILQWYQEEFRARLCQPNARLMVIGYSFLDEHINDIILEAYRSGGLQTFIVNPRGKDVLAPTGTAKSLDIQEIKLIGDCLSPLSQVFGGNTFARDELLRFFR